MGTRKGKRRLETEGLIPPVEVGYSFRFSTPGWLATSTESQRLCGRTIVRWPKEFDSPQRPSNRLRDPRGRPLRGSNGIRRGTAMLLSCSGGDAFNQNG